MSFSEDFSFDLMSYIQLLVPRGSHVPLFSGTKSIIGFCQRQGFIDLIRLPSFLQVLKMSLDTDVSHTESQRMSNVMSQTRVDTYLAGLRAGRI
jgi:hypothetical protein